MAEMIATRKPGREPRRSRHAHWVPWSGRDPVALLTAGDEDRLADLRALRWERLAASPFALLRGSAAVMAADLATLPSTDIIVQAVGDAHLANFGVFATPERRLVFDLNDFDETFRAPFEWDLKRLAVSVRVAGAAAGHRASVARDAARLVVVGYRDAIRRIARLPYLDAWYLGLDAETILRRLPAEQAAAADRLFAKARRRTSARAVARLTVPSATGRPQLRDDPPLLVRMPLTETDLVAEFRHYLDSLPVERRALLERYRPIDVARKVVGVGSVGTRCLIVLLRGRSLEDLLILQVKEAGPSVLESALEVEHPGHHGQRVVEGQRLLQSAGDPFLGWSTGPDGRHFYWRQLWDMKGSADVERFRPAGLRAYAYLCGLVLARGHARSGDAEAIARYVGRSDALDRAIVAFADAYAQQVSADWRLVVAEAARLANESG